VAWRLLLTAASDAMEVMVAFLNQLPGMPRNSDIVEGKS
jgi:hypothetical protein